MDEDKLNRVLVKLAREHGSTVAAQVSEYIDAKLEAELSQINLRLDHLDVMLKLILTEMDGGTPEYTVTTHLNGSKTITVRAPKLHSDNR